MQLSPHDIASRLRKWRNNGRNKFMACCPAHDDNSPSLHIGIGRNNKVVVHCFSGCPQSEVIQALKDMGAWPEKEKDDSIPYVYQPSDRDLQEYDRACLVVALVESDIKRGIIITSADHASLRKAEDVVRRFSQYFHWENLTGIEWRRLHNRRYEIATRELNKVKLDWPLIH